MKINIALIKCSGCKNEVSNEDNYCLYCGKEITKNSTVYISSKNKYAAPLNNAWFMKYIKKAKRINIGFLFAFVIISAPTLFIVAQHVKRPIYPVLLTVTFFVVITWFIFFIIFMLSRAVYAKACTENGYTVLVYRGLLKTTLFIENEIQGVGFGETNLYGELPNGKKVEVRSHFIAPVEISTYNQSEKDL